MSTDLAGLVICTIHLVNKALSQLLSHLGNVLPHLVYMGEEEEEEEEGTVLRW